MDNVVKLNTAKQQNEARVQQIAQAIASMAPELQGLVMFGKCHDGTFVTMTANSMDLSLLGYTQAQISAHSAQVAYALEEDAEVVQLPTLED